jgi:hypothetical protein
MCWCVLLAPVLSSTIISISWSCCQRFIFEINKGNSHNNTFEYILSAVRPTEVRNHTFSSRRRNKSHLLVVWSFVADKTMDDDLVVMKGTHCSSSCAVSTRSAENTPSNSSPNSRLFVLLSSPSSRSTKYTCKTIEMPMKQQSDRYVCVHDSNGYASECWNLFGFLALIESVGEQTKTIEKFVMCHLCFTTYSFNSNITRLMNSHSCKTITRARSVSVADNLNSLSTYRRRGLTSYATPSVTKTTRRTNHTNERLAISMSVQGCTSVHRCRR